MNKPLPTCRKCKAQVVIADAGIFKAIRYYYCRTCKVEVDRFGYALYAEKKEALNDLEDYLETAIPTEKQLEIEFELDTYPLNPFKYKIQDDQDQDIGSLSSRFASGPY